MSDSSIPSDDLVGLPDLDESAEPVDRFLLLQDTVRETGARLGELTAQGVELRDGHTLITATIIQAFLEEILRAVAGEEAVIEVGLRVHKDLAAMIEGARSQVNRAKLSAPLHNGRTTSARPSA